VLDGWVKPPVALFGKSIVIRVGRQRGAAPRGLDCGCDGPVAGRRQHDIRVADRAAVDAEFGIAAAACLRVAARGDVSFSMPTCPTRCTPWGDSFITPRHFQEGCNEGKSNALRMVPMTDVREHSGCQDRARTHTPCCGTGPSPPICKSPALVSRTQRRFGLAWCSLISARLWLDAMVEPTCHDVDW